MNQSFRLSLVGLFALLFALLAPLANAQGYLTSAEVETNYGAYVAIGRTAPEFLYAAHFYGDSVWIFSDGTYRLGSETAHRNQEIQQQTYEDVMAVTGDYILASQAAAGFLTPDELEEARNAQYGGGGYQFLGWVSSPWGNYSDTGGGGGGYLY